MRELHEFLLMGKLMWRASHAGKYSAKEIVIATGSKPVELPFLPYDGKVVVHSDHGIAFDRVPKKMAVVGAGAIGLELGCVWSRLGAEVEIIEFLPEICPQLDPEMSKIARRIFEKQGLSFRLETKVASAKIKGGKATLSVRVLQRQRRVDGGSCPCGGWSWTLHGWLGLGRSWR